MEKLFTKKEAANYMKVSERTVSRMIKSMSLRIYRVGRQVRIPATSINKMLKGAKADGDYDKMVNSILEV